MTDKISQDKKENPMRTRDFLDKNIFSQTFYRLNFAKDSNLFIITVKRQR